jgi:hypothetical protein
MRRDLACLKLHSCFIRKDWQPQAARVPTHISSSFLKQDSCLGAFSRHTSSKLQALQGTFLVLGQLGWHSLCSEGEISRPQAVDTNQHKLLDWQP